MTALAALLAAAPTPPVPLDHCVYLAVALFAVGVVGVCCRRNILIVLLSVEIMLNAANLALVAFSRLHGNLDGQIVVFFAMTVAAAEVAVGLAIVIALYRLRQSTDIDDSTELADQDYGPMPPLQLEGEDHHHDHDDHHDGDDHGASDASGPDGDGPDGGDGGDDGDGDAAPEAPEPALAGSAPAEPHAEGGN